MDRSRIKNHSDSISARYGSMLAELTARATLGQVQPHSRIQYLYVRVTALSSIWDGTDLSLADYMSRFVSGFFYVDSPLSVVFQSDGKSLEVYCGSDAIGIDALIGLLRGVFPQVDFESGVSGNPTLIRLSELEPAWDSKMLFNGFVKGNPQVVDGNKGVPLDEVIGGMRGRPFAVLISAIPEPVTEPISARQQGVVMSTVGRQRGWMQMASWCSTLSDVSYSDTDNMQTTTYRQRYLNADLYSQKVDAFCERSAESVALGEWCVSYNYAATTRDDARLLGGLLTSAFYAEEAMPEPVHAIMRIHDEGRPWMPLVRGWDYAHDSFLGETAPFPRYASLLSSKELAIFVSPPSKDTLGMAVVDSVEFDVHREVSGNLSIGTIQDGRIQTGVPYSIDANELNRHALVIGLTGSGKTNTTKSILCSMADSRKLPFMVIEPAKKEYWELYKLGYDDLQVYSVGSTEPEAHRLCINPFERPSYIDDDGISHSVPLQTHVDFVYAAFKASFIMYTPMPYVLERAIYEIYEDCGWDIHADVCASGNEVFPTIEDLYFKIPEVVISMGYDQRMRNDLIGSLQARINSLRLGSKGEALNVRRSFSFDKLLRGKTVIELEDIGDDDVKAFIISLLLINLLEVRRQQQDSQLEVRHLMLIEEAHRLLKNVQGGTGESADPRAAAVDFFCNLLAELRSKGQGFIIADQIPSKLAPDLVKNTNLKICHRVVAADERALMGGAMHMRDDQIEALASLRQGVAAVYSEGDERPKLVKPPYAGSHFVPGRAKATRSEVLAAVSHCCIHAKGNPAYETLTDSQTVVCRRCNSHCNRKPEDVLTRMRGLRDFELLASQLDPKVVKSCQALRIDRNIRSMLDHSVPDWDAKDTKYRYCVLNLLLKRWRLDAKLEARLIDVYMSRL